MERFHMPLSNTADLLSPKNLTSAGGDENLESIKIEATALALDSPNKHFPFLYGITLDSIIMEFIGNKSKLTPGKSLKKMKLVGRYINFMVVA